MLGLSDWTCQLLLNRNTWKLLSILMPSCGWDAAILAASSFVGANGFLTQRQRDRERERDKHTAFLCLSETPGIHPYDASQIVTTTTAQHGLSLNAWNMKLSF